MKILLIGSEGYVGSFLWSKFDASENELHALDIKIPANEKKNFIHTSYQDVDINLLSKFDVVLFFAGVSSVKQANENVTVAVEQNMLDMWDFALRCAKAKTRLIYASSGSVYADSTGNLLFTASEMTYNAYDASKLAFDLISHYANPSALGLRMGTVSGWSPQLRRELIFNAMCISAIEQKKIFVSNPHNYRSILFLDDLYAILQRVLASSDCKGQIPCSSYAGTIGQVASAIGAYFSADIELLEGSSTYSFALKKSPFDTLLPPSIEQECAKFKKSMEVIQ
jgi:UDP-glucose 4-epimerase